jgi:hypothetical protein
MFDTLKVAQAEKQIYPQSMGQTNGVEGTRAETRGRRATSGACAALWCIRFVGLAAALGEAAWSAAVRWWFVYVAVESFGMAASAQLPLW